MSTNAIHILVADDDDQVRMLLKRVLAKAGYEVSEARNGNEAVRLFKLKPAALLITDLIMPDKEGIETIQEFRRNQTPVKIIAMSGGGRLDQNMYLSMAKKIGADRVLSKPFLPQELLKVVQELTGSAPATPPAA
ncbi:MAG TPA: response regulator [Opitutaceae bacterium]|nr:response regulator [Opitutaceae bacterium]